MNGFNWGDELDGADEKEVKVSHSLIEKGYNIIYTDPPWKQSKARGKPLRVRPNSSGKEFDYDVMELPDIVKLHEELFEKYAFKQHNVFMWTIEKYLVETYLFMNELGYKSHATFIWNKLSGPSPSFSVRFSHEYLIWFYKEGSIYKVCDEMRMKYGTVMTERNTVHSKKPLCAYEMIENLFPEASKLELFARGKRLGWDCWGNEIE